MPKKKSKPRPDWDDGRVIAPMDVEGIPRGQGKGKNGASGEPPAQDDGRVVAPMNVEGMPWYTKGQAPDAPQGPSGEPLSKRDTRKIALVATCVAIGLALVFVAAGALFIWFCTDVWFR